MVVLTRLLSLMRTLVLSLTNIRNVLLTSVNGIKVSVPKEILVIENAELRARGDSMSRNRRIRRIDSKPLMARIRLNRHFHVWELVEKQSFLPGESQMYNGYRVIEMLKCTCGATRIIENRSTDQFHRYYVHRDELRLVVN